MSFLPCLSAETGCLWVAALTLLFLYGVWPFSFFKKIGVPGPRPLPFLGTSLSYRKGIHTFDLDCFYKYGRIWGIFDGRQPSLLVTDPAIIKNVMVKECYTTFTNRRDVVLVGPLSDALSLVKDEKWKRIRGVLSPTFTSGRLKEVFPLVQYYGELMMKNLKKLNYEKPVEIKEIVGPYSMDVITSASFSVDIDSINNPKDPFVTKIKEMLKFSFFNPILWILTAFPFLAPLLEKMGMALFPKESMEFFYSALRRIKDEHHTHGSNRVDFLQLMIQSQISDEQANAKEKSEAVKGLTDHEILSQSLIFIVAGYETTSTTLSFLAYNLATNPEAMQKLQEEIDAVFPNNAPVTYERLMQMEYLEMALNESMRLWPTAPRIERYCKQTVEINGVTIPGGTVVNVPVFVLHRDPSLWESPEVFKPERFGKENKDNVDPYTFLPFGTGPRNCIGMRFAVMVMKLAIVKLLQRFSLEACEETQIPIELNTMYQPKKPITLKLVPRAAAKQEQ